jgi:hypothetical protein
MTTIIDIEGLCKSYQMGENHPLQTTNSNRKNIPESEAIKALINLIKTHGDW